MIVVVVVVVVAVVAVVIVVVVVVVVVANSHVFLLCTLHYTTTFALKVKLMVRFIRFTHLFSKAIIVFVIFEHIFIGRDIRLIVDIGVQVVHKLIFIL